MKDQIKIGVDTGGTFTDFVIFKDGEVTIKKIPSTPENPSKAILEGVREFLGQEKPPFVIHGSTVATNALLERKGGKIALLTTAGFEDIIAIGRQTRKNLFSLKGEERIPLLPPDLCFGITERIDAFGEIIDEAMPKEIESILEMLERKGIQSVAVCFLNSYVNLHNERVAHKILLKKGIPASVSSQLLPEYREYERTVTTTVNAYLMPVMGKYISDLKKNLCDADLRIMQSNEGYISPEKACLEPIRTALSGPTGGVVGSRFIASTAGFDRIIAFDMGGTSTDVSLIDGAIRMTAESNIGGFPVRLPIIDIHTVGSGGGSIAYVDRAGALKVGPESAGADPGPACYGKSLVPTVTDANIVLGRIDPSFFLGGAMKVFPERSAQSLEKLSSLIKKPLVETAEGIIEIANTLMEKAIRVISVERGIDPRGFHLFSFGGAGGLHAVELAERLSLAGVIVPKNAGVLSALGLLLADSIKDYSRSVLKPAQDVTNEQLKKMLEDLIKVGIKEMTSDGFREENIAVSCYLDLRYSGQSYEITVPFGFEDENSGGTSFIQHFHNEHRKLYTYQRPEAPVEIVNIRVKVIGKTPKIPIKKSSTIATVSKNGRMKQQFTFHRGRRHQADVYNRALLQPGQIIRGAAVVSDYESTAFIPAGYKGVVDPYLNLIIGKG